MDEANESPLQMSDEKTSSPETEKSAGDRVPIDEPVSGTNPVPLQRKRNRKRKPVSGKSETSGSTGQTASRRGRLEVVRRGDECLSQGQGGQLKKE